MGSTPRTGRRSPDERQLADHQRRPLGHLQQIGGDEDPERDGQVERRALLAQIRGREVDGDLLLRELVPAVAQRA